MNVVKMLKQEEGYREHAYYCSEGYPTIGVGWKLGPKGASLDNYKYMSVSEEIAGIKCGEKIEEIKSQLARNLPFFFMLSYPRQGVLISMAYQMGTDGLLKFKRMIAAMKAEDYETASTEGLDSRWAIQTPVRANRQMKTLKSGTWDEYL